MGFIHNFLSHTEIYLQRTTASGLTPLPGRLAPSDISSPSLDYHRSKLLYFPPIMHICKWLFY
jgi:hypothetical protein